MGILNYTPQPHTVLYGEDSKYYTVTNAFGDGIGVMVKLPSSNFPRYLTRVTVNTTSVTATDTFGWSIGTFWDDQQATAPFYLSLGSPTNQDYLDYTTFGDKNIAEYAVPLLIPAHATLFGLWPTIYAVAARKCICIMDLAT